MNKVKIVTDSTVDLSKEIIRKYQIDVVPLTISIDGEDFIDRVDITPSQFLEKMKLSSELPKSSQPPAGTFMKRFEELGKDGSEILSIHLAGELSGTVHSAASAAKMAGLNVRVFDSGFTSKALSFQVIEAAEMARQGYGASEIIERLQIIKANTRLLIMVDTLENLVKGGRIGRANFLIGSFLHIKPIASFEDGALHPLKKARSHSQVINFLIHKFSEDFLKFKIRGVGIAHAGSLDLSLKLKESIVKETGFAEITIDETTPIISTHTGPGAMALMYYFD
ncbi:DegV family protein [Peribacillus kribbensis]|uniref:DegV family protein n=1 Tax=Peribacillus kribbensis TaxID=356658 RepID=UPI00047EBA4A|nr:DegV family protein [Peribacillus kribbensis]